MGMNDKARPAPADGRQAPFSPAARRRPALRSLRAILAIGALSLGTVLLAACSGAALREAAAPRQGAAAPRPTAVNGAAGFGAASAGSAGSSASLVIATQSIIYTADLTLRVKDVTATATIATGIVTDAGGYVAGERQVMLHRNHATPLVTLTLKIPVSAYHQTLAKLAALGRQVSFSQHAQDVTQRVADVGSRVASAQAAIRQLRALLAKAGSVSALLQVQDEINSQESALEALLAQQRTLARETSYATVTVTLLGHHVVIVKKPKKASGGFGTGLRDGWHALVVVVRAVLTALGAALPFLVPVALIAALAWVTRRRLTRRRPPRAGPPAAAQS